MTIVRYAPSPTGLLHLGNARPALLNWLFKLKTGGTYVLRLDDTDVARSTAEFAAGIERDLDCGEPYRGNAYIDEKLQALPTTLKEAGELLHESKVARDAFGDSVVDFYVHTARQEVKAFDGAVTDWERVRYFERI